MARDPPSYPVLRELHAVFVRPLIARELLREPFFVPHLEMVDLAKHAHIADDRAAVAQLLRDDNAPLRVELALLSVVADAIEELENRRMVRGGLRQPLLDLEPDGHRINEHGLACHARDEDVGPALVLDQAAEQRRDFETTFVVDTCRGASP